MTIYLTERNGRWHFGTRSLLRAFALSFTLKGWHSQYACRQAARREYRGKDITFRHVVG